MWLFLLLNTLIVIISLVFHNYIKESQRRFVMVILMIEFALLMATRPVETPDTQIYIRGYLRASWNWLSDFNILKKYGDVYEYGYIILMLLFKNITDNSTIFFFFTTIVGLGITIYSLNYFTNLIENDNTDELSDKNVIKDNSSINILTVFSFYICSFGLLYNGISVRAGLSMGLGLLSVILFLKKKRIISLLTLLIAFCIHRTSILYIVVLLLIIFAPEMSKKAHWIIWSICGLLLFTNFGSFLYSKIIPLLVNFMIGNSINGSLYLTEASSGVTAGHTSILRWFIYGFLIFFSLDSKYYKKFLNCISVGILIMSLFNGVTAISRAYDVFLMFSVPMYYSLYKHKSDLIHNNRIKKAVIYGALFLNFYIMLRLCIINTMLGF